MKKTLISVVAFCLLFSKVAFAVDVTYEELSPYTGVWDATRSDASLVGKDTDAIHDNVAGEINAIAEKGSPVNADMLIIEDSADSNNKKKIEIGNLPTGWTDDGSNVFLTNSPRNVGIGTNTPLRLLDVRGDISTSGDLFNTTQAFDLYVDTVLVHRWTAVASVFKLLLEIGDFVLLEDNSNILLE